MSWATVGCVLGGWAPSVRCPPGEDVRPDIRGNRRTGLSAELALNARSGVSCVSDKGEVRPVLRAPSGYVLKVPRPLGTCERTCERARSDEQRSLMSLHFRVGSLFQA